MYGSLTMAWIGGLSLGATDFPLGRVFEQWPSLTLELDRVVPSGDTVMPFFWVHSSDRAYDLETIQRFIDDLPELRCAELLESLENRALFGAEWKPEYMGIMRAIPRADLTVLSATGSRDGWMFELRAATSDQFSLFRQYCSDEGIDISLTSLIRLAEQDTVNAYGLTAEQREALRLAFEQGYYEDPRQTSMEALAARVGISRQAFSARLRRGYRNLLSNTLIQGVDSTD